MKKAEGRKGGRASDIRNSILFQHLKKKRPPPLSSRSGSATANWFFIVYTWSLITHDQYTWIYINVGVLTFALVTVSCRRYFFILSKTESCQTIFDCIMKLLYWVWACLSKKRLWQKFWMLILVWHIPVTLDWCVGYIWTRVSIKHLFQNWNGSRRSGLRTNTQNNLVTTKSDIWLLQTIWVSR